MFLYYITELINVFKFKNFNSKKNKDHILNINCYAINCKNDFKKFTY